MCVQFSFHLPHTTLRRFMTDRHYMCVFVFCFVSDLHLDFIFPCQTCEISRFSPLSSQAAWRLGLCITFTHTHRVRFSGILLLLQVASFEIKTHCEAEFIIFTPLHMIQTVLN